jgi:hypothetical protein
MAILVEKIDHELALRVNGHGHRSVFEWLRGGEGGGMVPCRVISRVRLNVFEE